MPSFWQARDERLGREVAIKGVIRVPRQKTDESVIPISAMCRAALEECSRFGAYVFTTAESKPFSVSTINRAFARAKKLAGIERRCRFKDLRHTFGSNLASNGVSLQKIAAAMGHASTRSTETVCAPVEGIASGDRFGAGFGNFGLFFGLLGCDSNATGGGNY